MSDEAVIVFTAKSIERILQEEGTSSWRLDRNHARHCAFVVCTRNAYADWVEGPEEHHSAFLVGKVRDVVPTRDPKSPDRFLIRFSEYALVNIPEVWKGDRNPVKYSMFETLGIDRSSLKWKKMPEVSESSRPAPDVVSSNGVSPLTIPEAKKGLALTFGVPPEAIEITIRG